MKYTRDNPSEPTTNLTPKQARAAVTFAAEAAKWRKTRHNPAHPALVALIGEEEANKVADIQLGVLAMAPVGRLKKLGLSDKAARTLRAGVELAIEAAQETPLLGTRLGGPQDVAAHMTLRVALLDYEQVWALFVDSRQRVVGDVLVTSGGGDKAPVDLRKFLRPALEAGAAGVFLVHNHPSGDTTASSADRRLTARAISACALVGLQLVDHIIIARGGFTSIRVNNALLWEGAEQEAVRVMG